MASSKTLAYYSPGLTDSNPRTVAGVSWALSSSTAYNPNRLLDLLSLEEVSKSAVIAVLAAHKQRLNVRELLRHSFDLEPGEKAQLFKLVGEIPVEAVRGELKSRVTRSHHQHTGQVQPARRGQGSGGATAGSQQADPLRRPLGVGAHGRLHQCQGALHAPAGSRARCAEQGGGRRHQAQSPGHGEVPAGRAQGRFRVRPPRRRGSAQ